MRALLLALLIAASPVRPPADTPLPASIPAEASSDEGRSARAAALLASGTDGKSRLLAESRSGPSSGRRAALLALATLPEEGLPEGTLAAALEGLASADPLLRAAAGRTILACGASAAAVLEKIVAGSPPEGLPTLPAGRAADALADLRRISIEREFLATWTSDDGSFRGMFSHLQRHGALGARVLAAVALDRRVAGTSVLSYGPYAWLADGAASRDRSEIRARALDALADAGDKAAREMLRPYMRAEPAAELYDDGDENPIPAAFDDSLREAIAALGDPEPLWRAIEASRDSHHGIWSDTVEMRRRAGAFAVLGHAAQNEEVRRKHFDQTVGLLYKAIKSKDDHGMAIDGVEYYNLACALARRDGKNDRAEAIGKLERSTRTYAVSSGWIERDGDLASLRGEPRFQDLLKRLKEREAKLLQGPPAGGK